MWALLPFRLGVTVAHTSRALDHAGTLKGFSTSAKTKMYDGCPGCPYKTYTQFYEYYHDYDYADKWVSAALRGENMSFTSGKHSPNNSPPPSPPPSPYLFSLHRLAYLRAQEPPVRVVQVTAQTQGRVGDLRFRDEQFQLRELAFVLRVLLPRFAPVVKFRARFPERRRETPLFAEKENRLARRGVAQRPGQAGGRYGLFRHRRHKDTPIG